MNTKEEFMKELAEDMEFAGADEQYKELMFLDYLLEQLVDKKVEVSLYTKDEVTVISSTYGCFDYQWGHEVDKPKEDAFLLSSLGNNDNRIIFGSAKIKSVEILEDEIFPSIITVYLKNNLQVSIMQMGDN